MKKILIIAKKEWQNYTYNLTYYVFAAVLILVVNWLFFQDFFVQNIANLNSLWQLMAFLFSIFIPAISMGLIADERKNSTWELILSLPIKEAELVMGKFLGALVYIISIIFLALPIIITVSLLGQPDWGLISGGLLGLLFLAMSYLALGIFASTIAKQSILAFLLSSLILIINSFMGQELVLNRLSPWLKDIVGFLSINWHSQRISQGLLELSDLSFFLSLTAIFLILSNLLLKSRKEK